MRPLVLARLQLPRELRQRHHRHLELQSHLLERLTGLADALELVARVGWPQELQIVHHDQLDAAQVVELRHRATHRSLEPRRVLRLDVADLDGKRLLGLHRLEHGAELAFVQLALAHVGVRHPDPITGHQHRKHALRQVTRRHLQRRDEHRHVLQGRMEREIERQSGLAHRRAPADHVKLARLQPARERVQIAKARGDAGKP